MRTSQKTGRPTIFKKGPLTAAERQRRHRKKLHREKKAAEVVAKREENHRRWRERIAKLGYKLPQPTPEALAKQARLAELFRLNPLLPNATEADEVARQIGEYLHECRDLGLTIADVRAAIDRRFGPP